MPTPQDYIVWNLSAVAVKSETVIGTDAIGGGTPAQADWLNAEATIRFPQTAAEDPSMNGSLDANAPIPTGIKPEIVLRVPLRGAGTAGTAPGWGKLMTACRFREQLTATAIGAPTALTAGTTGTGTLAATPFSGVAQAYRGMPLALTVNPVGGAILPITDYTAGRVAKLPFVFPTALSTATLAQIVAHALYSPTSDLSLLKPVTIYGFRNGMRHRFVGCVGSASLEMNAGQPAFISFTMRGLLLSGYEAVPLPTGWNQVALLQPPVWANGISRLDGLLCNCAKFTWDLGNELVDPENPEAAQGFDNPMIVSAAQKISIDPFANSTRSPTRFSKYQQGQAVEFAAAIGTTPGNRVFVSQPSGIITSMDESNRSKLGVDQMQLTPNVPDAGVFLAVA